MSNLLEEERAKYEDIWKNVPEYRDHSPGLENVDRFMSVVKPILGSTIADIGCGTGAAGIQFAKKGLRVHWIDITAAGLLSQVPRDNFLERCLWTWRQDNWGFDFGFCCDVMEHIPPEFSMLSASNIVRNCYLTWFQIALVKDNFGEAIGKPLHLTVRPFKWWADSLRQIGQVVDARDLCQQGLYLVRRS